MESTKKCWEASRVVFNRQGQKGVASLDVLMSTGLEKEVITEMGGSLLEEPAD